MQFGYVIIMSVKQCMFNGGLRKFHLSDLQPVLKYARYFDPVKVSELCPCSTNIAFPFLNGQLEDLKEELPIATWQEWMVCHLK